MNFKHELTEMKKRMFTDEMLEHMLDDYITRSGETVGEAEYRAAKVALADLLDENEMTILSEIERLFKENARYALSFGFEHGIFAFFRYWHDRHSTETPFDFYARTRLLTMPFMVDEKEFYDRRQAINSISGEFKDALEVEARKHVLSVEVTLEEREEGILAYAFYLGYRYAADLIKRILGEENHATLMNMLLRVEREIGFTCSLAEIE